MSGGGAKGAFQYGALAYLKSKGMQFSAVSGVSVGALNGAMVAMGKVPELGEVWNTISNEKVYSGGLNLHGLVRILTGRRSFFSNNPLKKIIDQHVHAEDFKIPYTCGLVDLTSGDYFSIQVSRMHLSHTVREAILASTAIPIIWEPVSFISWVYASVCTNAVDGGLRNQTPLADMIRVSDVDEIVVILTSDPVCLPAVANSQLKTVDQIALQAIDIMSHEIYYSDVAGALRVNNLVKQASEKGMVLTNGSGTPYRYVPIKVIAPTQIMPGMLDFSTASVQGSIQHGTARATEVMENYQWGE